MTHSRFPKTLQSIGEDDMRKDMAKVIVERPRQGRYTRIKKTPRDFEDCPSKEGMRKPYLNRKSLNENLNPLWRFLERNINRPWDKVYSEICENLKTTSTVQQHVRDHIKGLLMLYMKRSVQHEIDSKLSKEREIARMKQWELDHKRKGI
jgi:hypothetical protein